MTARYVLFGINPEPWTSPSVGIGRRSGKPYPVVSKSAALKAYQEAVKEALAEAGAELVDGPIELTFYFWRQLAAGENYETGRRTRRKRADATNMQKATEDACQGVLFPNDREVVHVHSWLMEAGQETNPMVVIDVRPFDGAYPTVNVTEFTHFNRVDNGAPAPEIATEAEIKDVF